MFACIYLCACAFNEIATSSSTPMPGSCSVPDFGESVNVADCGNLYDGENCTMVCSYLYEGTSSTYFCQGNGTELEGAHVMIDGHDMRHIKWRLHDPYKRTPKKENPHTYARMYTLTFVCTRTFVILVILGIQIRS